MSERNVQESGRSSGDMVDTAAEYPIFYKKKVLPLNKLKEVLHEAKEIMRENSQYVANERSMLERITARHDEFVERLETKLEDYKEENASHVTLVEDELPDWPLLASDVSDGDSESVRRLKEWHEVMVNYVDRQRQHTTRVIERWFNADKFKHGEEDAYTRIIEPTVRQSVSKFTEGPMLYLYAIFVLVYSVYVYLYAKTEDVTECTDKPGKCMAEAIMNFLVLFHHRYLEFRNITEKDLNISALNVSRLTEVFFE